MEYQIRRVHCHIFFFCMCLWFLVPSRPFHSHKDPNHIVSHYKVHSFLFDSWFLLCLQTMTTTDTRNVAGTVEQVKRCADLGADIVRITVQGKQEARACHEIREQLFKDRYNTLLTSYWNLLQIQWGPDKWESHVNETVLMEPKSTIPYYKQLMSGIPM